MPPRCRCSHGHTGANLGNYESNVEPLLLCVYFSTGLKAPRNAFLGWRYGAGK